MGDFAPGEEEPQWDDDFAEIVARRLQGLGENVIGAAELEARHLLGNDDYDRIKDHHLKLDSLNLESMVLGVETARVDLENTKAIVHFNYAVARYRVAAAKLVNSIRWAVVLGVLSGIGWEISRAVH